MSVSVVAGPRRVARLQARWHLQAQCLRSGAKEPATARYRQRVTSKGVSQVEINAGPRNHFCHNSLTVPI